MQSSGNLGVLDGKLAQDLVLELLISGVHVMMAREALLNSGKLEQ